jgi:spore germination cell wall hydrolase CwlJ-like protein
MFSRLKSSLGALRYMSPASLWNDLRFWWYTGQRGPVLLFGGIFLSLSSAAALIAHAMELTHVERQIQCLALNVYHEARGESVKGQYAVAEVTVNRKRSTRFPDSICAVVYEKRWDRIRKRYVGAFSWTELSSSEPKPDAETWQRAKAIAEQVYYQHHEPLVAGALYYHARHIRPSWARTKHRVARIGRHVFYR